MKNQLEERKVLPDAMFGFRLGRGTTDAVNNVLDGVKDKLANGKKVAVIALDASSAFNLLSRELVVETLKIAGAGPLIARWLSTCLSDRYSFIEIDNKRSRTWLVDIGVPEGGLASPDEYSIGTISMPLWSDISESTLYADDSSEVD